jgi:hypothetical protein
LKQIKTDIGNVSTIRTMLPTVANISMNPPLCPSAAGRTVDDGKEKEIIISICFLFW